MLVLDRKPGQSVMVGDEVEIFVLEIGGKLKLGINAPRELAVHRKEVWLKINGQEPEAAPPRTTNQPATS